MRRVFSDYAYGAGPREGCYWDQTCDLPRYPALKGALKADVAIIGAGFTGLNAALTLAKSGASVAVLDAQQPGWGASGRNGGFCCLGGGKASDAFLDRRFGKESRLDWRRAEVAAVQHVAALIEQNAWDVDRHSHGETLLAHRPMSLEPVAAEALENYAVDAEALDPTHFGGSFHAALTIPHGFGLNPRKYFEGLLGLAAQLGVRIFGESQVNVTASGVRGAQGHVVAPQRIVATNGYSSEDVPHWLGARYMPAQSNVMVTRPLTEAEMRAQGWQSTQMCYDTRNLLHYFRLMPDNRFLFGMRGGLFSNALAEKRARQRLRRHFDRMFPAWRHVESEGSWSGLVALARGQMPFVGPVPGQRGLFASLCYHGNGVAMGSYSGHLLAQLLLGDERRPAILHRPLERFPLGPARRCLMPPLYAALAIKDRLA